MSWQIICSVKVNRFSALLIQSQGYRDQAPVDQEVGGSSPPSCTSKIKYLDRLLSLRDIAVSALCPHSQCRTSSPEALMAVSRSARYMGPKGERQLCQKSRTTRNDLASIA